MRGGSVTILFYAGQHVVDRVVSRHVKRWLIAAHTIKIYITAKLRSKRLSKGVRPGRLRSSRLDLPRGPREGPTNFGRNLTSAAGVSAVLIAPPT